MALLGTLRILSRASSHEATFAHSQQKEISQATSQLGLGMKEEFDVEGRIEPMCGFHSPYDLPSLLRTLTDCTKCIDVVQAALHSTLHR